MWKLMSKRVTLRCCDHRSRLMEVRPGIGHHPSNTNIELRGSKSRDSKSAVCKNDSRNVENDNEVNFEISKVQSEGDEEAEEEADLAAEESPCEADDDDDGALWESSEEETDVVEVVNVLRSRRQSLSSLPSSPSSSSSSSSSSSAAAAPPALRAAVAGRAFALFSAYARPDARAAAEAASRSVPAWCAGPLEERVSRELARAWQRLSAASRRSGRPAHTPEPSKASTSSRYSLFSLFVFPMVFFFRSPLSSKGNCECTPLFPVGGSRLSLVRAFLVLQGVRGSGTARGGCRGCWPIRSTSKQQEHWGCGGRPRLWPTACFPWQVHRPGPGHGQDCLFA